MTCQCTKVVTLQLICLSKCMRWIIAIINSKRCEITPPWRVLNLYTHVFVYSYCLRRPETEQHEEFKRRCNAFFMEVIYLLSFSSNAPPNHDVIEKLMNYIICERVVGETRRGATKRPTVFDDAVDPTPVLRSFLLQLLLRFRFICHNTTTFIVFTSGCRDGVAFFPRCLVILLYRLA